MSKYCREEFATNYFSAQSNTVYHNHIKCLPFSFDIFTLQGRGWVKRKEENEGFVLESSVFTTLSVLSDALFASCGPINWLRVNVNEARDKNTNTQIQIKLQDVPQSTTINKAEHTNTSSPECFVKFDDRSMEKKELKMPTRHLHNKILTKMYFKL